ncbi:MAG: preprotein translocase subunit SecY [Nitrospirae bacterium GWC2_56_14]|nr:MAG: preprotein translocase subunit SecY [Nitrospirae bacterium GWC2_56_14]
MFTGIKNIFNIPELRKRVFFTLLMLAVYRIGAYIPTPGVRGDALSQYLHQAASGLMGFFDMFSGGALSRVTIFALGIMPYITASIVLQLLTVVIPRLQALAKEGESGRKKITEYTRYGTVVIAAFQSFWMAVGIEKMGGGAFVESTGWSFRILTMITLTAGTTFIMWLGEQITERGIGNGISLIIFAGIVAGFPSAVINTFGLVTSGEIPYFMLAVILVIIVSVIAAIILMERGQRKISVQYAQRMVGRKIYKGQSTHLPLKINSAGVIPPIFASSILMFPATIASFTEVSWVKDIAGQLAPGRLLYTTVYVVMIVFFAFFYTAIVFNPVDIAENLKKYGGFIPGIRPGKKTSDYLYRVLTRITLGGALYLAAVCVLPDIFYKAFNVPFYFGGTSLLIVIGVALDTVSQIESHLIQRHYGGFLKGVSVKGRR